MNPRTSKIEDLQPHPLSLNLYGEDDIDASFIESIKESGIRVPLVIKSNGFIISGCRRWKAAKFLGLQEVPVVIETYVDAIMERRAVLEFNKYRDKTEIQKYAEAQEWEKIIAEENQIKKLAELKQFKTGGNTVVDAGQQRGDEKKTVTDAGRERGSEYERKTNTQVAQKVGLGPRQYRELKKIKKAVDAGNPVAQEVWQRLADGKETVSKAYKKLQRQRAREQAPPLPEGKYDIIYADPPWPYRNAGLDSSAETHYPTLALTDICNLPIADLAADNCTLFLWVTNPFLREGLKVCDEWGFQYKTNFLWVKKRSGTGFYALGQHELLFVAVKGSHLPEKIQSSVLFADSERHSQKPIIVYELIEKMYPNSNYIELFARHKRENWEVWGDEISED